MPKRYFLGASPNPLLMRKLLVLFRAGWIQLLETQRGWYVWQIGGGES